MTWQRRRTARRRSSSAAHRGPQTWAPDRRLDSERLAGPEWVVAGLPLETKGRGDASVGCAVAVVIVGVVVAALGAEEQGGEHEQAAAEDQHGGQGETGCRVFHGGVRRGC